MLYTAQYRYSGPDRLDITVKGQDPSGKMFAPTWDIVMGIKNKTMSEKEYTSKYYTLLINRWNESMQALADKAKTEDVTFVCFCKADTFCHRYLLVNFLIHNFNTPYGGER